MKIALINGGQPRFTPDFLLLMEQLQGFDQADLYLNFWNSAWASNEQEARNKIERILQPKYSLAKVALVNEPPYELPPHKLDHAPATPENIRWWFQRRIGMWRSLKMAFDLIDKDYDAVIRFRPDGHLGNSLDISKLDLKNNELLFPTAVRCGFDDFKVCDQFAVGTVTGMKFYCGLADCFTEYVPKADPNWELNGHGTWSSEHVFGTYMKAHNKQQVLGPFKAVLTSFGRSEHTDKHYHLPVVKDPTSS